MDTLERIKAQIETNDMMLYMKGTPDFPQCGFSAQVARILELVGAKYHFINILENQDIRQTLPQYANWPTFPQLWVKGELIGGCDIVTDLYEKGELATMLTEKQLTADKVEFAQAD